MSIVLLQYFATQCNLATPFFKKIFFRHMQVILCVWQGTLTKNNLKQSTILIKTEDLNLTCTKSHSDMTYVASYLGQL